MNLPRKLLWIPWIGAWSLILLLIISFTSYVILLLPPIQKRTLDLIEKQIDKQIVGTISIGRIQGSVLWELTAFDIKVKDRHGRDDSIAVSRVKVTYSLLDLLQKKVHISAVDVNGVNAKLSVTPDKKLCIPVLPVPRPKKPKKPTDWKVELGHISVHGINASYNDSNLQMRGIVAGAQAKAEFIKIDSIKLTLLVPDGSYKSLWWTGTADTIFGHGTLTRKGLMIHKSLVSGAGSIVRGTGFVPFNVHRPWNLTARITTDLQPVTSFETYVPLLKNQGRAVIDAHWSGPIRKPNLKLELSAINMDYAGISIDSLRVHGTYEQNHIKGFTEIITGRGKVSSSADIHVPLLLWGPVFKEYQIHSEVDSFPLVKLTSMVKFPLKYLSTMASAQATIQGYGIDDFPTLGRFDLNLFGGTGPRINQANIALTLDSNDLTITGDWSKNSITGKGVISNSGLIDGSVAIQVIEPNAPMQLFFKERMTGKIFVNSSITGTFKRPVVNSTIYGSKLEWRSNRCDSLFANVEYQKDSIKINKGSMFVDLVLDSLGKKFKIDSLQGLVSGNVEFSGTIPKISVQADIEGSELSYNTISLDTVKGLFNLIEGDSIEWDNVWIRRLTSALKTNGALRFGKVYNGKGSINLYYLDARKNWVSSGQCALNGMLQKDSIHSTIYLQRGNLAALNNWAGIRDLYGTINAELEVNGAIKNPTAHLSLSGQQLLFQNHQIPSLYTTSNLKDSTIISSVKVGISNNKAIWVDAEIPIHPQKFTLNRTRTSPVRLLLKGDSLDLSDFAEVMGPLYKASGPLNMNLELLGTANQWLMRGGVNLKNGKIQDGMSRYSVKDLNLRSVIHGTLERPAVSIVASTDTIHTAGVFIRKTKVATRIIGRSIIIDSLNAYFADNGLVKIKAQAPIPVSDSLFSKPDLVAQFIIDKMPLALVNQYIPNPRFQKGLLNGEGHIEIIQGLPSAHGFLSIRDGTFSLPEVSSPIRSFNSDITLNGNRVVISSLNANMGGGKLKGNGRFDWSKKGLSDVDISMRANDVKLAISDMFETIVQTAQLRFTDARNGYNLSGDVHLGGSKFVQEYGINEIINQIQEGQTIRREPDTNLQKIALQVKVHLDENLGVDINIGYFEVGGDFSVVGTAAQPTFTGEIVVNDGHVFYLDRRFQIVKATLYNADPQNLNPTIDLEAITEVSTFDASPENKPVTYEITLRVTGDLEHPEVILTSEPDLTSQADIISVLTFGQRIGTLGNDISSRLQNFAGQRLAGFGARQLEKFLQLERIDISGNVFNPDSSQNTTVTISKRFLSRLLVTYETGIGNLNRRRLYALLRLTRKWFLQGETDEGINNNKRQSGIDLIFKYSK